MNGLSRERRNGAMLSDRISAVLETMEVTISDVARAGGCTPSNLNRIKNGVRTPQPASPTIRYFTDGIIEIARQRNRAGELCSLCGANLRDSEDTVRTKLIEWLYEDEPPYIRTYNKKNTGRSDAGRMISTLFSKRLDDLLKLSGYSNRRLGAEVGLDPSYVSRLRRGERIPRYSSPYLMQICESILERITAEGKLPQLYDLTSMSEVEVTEKDAADGLRRWLFGYGPVTGYMAADELLGTISSIDKIMQASPAQTSVQDALDRILEQSEQNCTFAENVSEMRYVGVDGIFIITFGIRETTQIGQRFHNVYLPFGERIDPHCEQSQIKHGFEFMGVFVVVDQGYCNLVEQGAVALAFLVNPRHIVPAREETAGIAVTGGGHRVIIACDGEHWVDSIKEAANQRYRQAVLERLGWHFVRVRGSQWYLDPDSALQKLKAELEALGITPGDAQDYADSAARLQQARYVQQRAEQLLSDWHKEETEA